MITSTLNSPVWFVQLHTLHESGNSGEIKKMFADEIFTLQKSTLLQCTRLPTIFADLGQTNAFYAKCFQKYQIISVHRKRCKPRTVEPDLQRILRFNYVYPKFLLSQFIVGFS